MSDRSPRGVISLVSSAACDSLPEELLERPDPCDEEAGRGPVRKHLLESLDHVGVGLGLGHTADGQPGEVVPQPQAHPSREANGQVRPICIDADAVWHEDHASRRRRPTPDRFIDGLAAHGSGDIRQPVRPSVGAVAPLRTLVFVVDRRDEDGSSRDWAGQPCEEVGVHHVRVQDIGLPASQQPEEPRGTPRVRHPPAHIERCHPNPLAFEVNQG